MYSTYKMYTTYTMYFMNHTINTREAVPELAMLLLTAITLGQRGAERVCGLSRRCQDLRASKGAYSIPGTYLEGGSR